jgi:MFS family permease
MSSSDTTQTRTTYCGLISIPKVVIMCLVLMTATTTQGFLDPTIEPHFRQYGIAPEYVGLVFLTMSAAYTISSPISGWFAGRIENKAPLMVIGLMVTSFGYVLLGPSKFLGLEPSFWLSSISMMILGLAYSLAFIPTFETILEAVIDRGLPDDVRTYSYVSGLRSCVNSLGEVTGAALGGVFIEHFSFTFGANSIALWTMAVAIILLVTYLIELCSHKRSMMRLSRSTGSIHRPSRGFSISADRSATHLMSDERIRLLIHHQRKRKGSSGSNHRDFIRTIP